MPSSTWTSLLSLRVWRSHTRQSMPLRVLAAFGEEREDDKRRENRDDELAVGKIHQQVPQSARRLRGEQSVTRAAEHDEKREPCEERHFARELARRSVDA